MYLPPAHKSGQTFLRQSPYFQTYTEPIFSDLHRQTETIFSDLHRQTETIFSDLQRQTETIFSDLWNLEATCMAPVKCGFPKIPSLRFHQHHQHFVRIFNNHWATHFLWYFYLFLIHRRKRKSRDTVPVTGAKPIGKINEFVKGPGDFKV